MSALLLVILLLACGLSRETIATFTTTSGHTITLQGDPHADGPALPISYVVKYPDGKHMYSGGTIELVSAIFRYPPTKDDYGTCNSPDGRYFALYRQTEQQQLLVVIDFQEAASYPAGDCKDLYLAGGLRAAVESLECGFDKQNIVVGRRKIDWRTRPAD